jgi:hypothetical protein
MSGYNTIIKCERIKVHADKLGFMLCHPKHGWASDDSSNTVAIKPKDQDSLPIYSRDAQFFSGTIDEMESFLRGIEWAREYDRLLRVSTDTKRERKEQDERNKQLVAMLKNEKVPEIEP